MMVVETSARSDVGLSLGRHRPVPVSESLIRGGHSEGFLYSGRFVIRSLIDFQDPDPLIP